MIIASKGIEILFSKFPDFKKTWKDYRDYWQTDSLTIHTYMSAFTDYVVELLISENDSAKVAEVFLIAETLMQDGDSEVQEAVATCFLENLINRSDTEFPALTFVKLLGEKSKEFCRGWDEFSGVRTPGLWEDEV